MNSPNLFILDVGHGNSAILQTDHGCAVFDAGLKNQLLEFLRKKSIYQISYVVLSHADADHIGGLIALLSNTEIRIGTIYLNTDSSKSSLIFESLLHCLTDALNDGRVDKVEAQATTNLEKQLSLGNVEVNIVAPDPIIAIRGPGAKKFGGLNHSTNSLSVVVRIVFDNQQAILLTGDVDLIGFRRLVDSGIELGSSHLVFPHHGGLPANQNLSEFLSLMHSSVSFKHSIFSIRKNRDKFPRREIVEALSLLDPGIRLITTQESKVLADFDPDAQYHLNGVGTLNLSPQGTEIMLTENDN